LEKREKKNQDKNVGELDKNKKIRRPKSRTQCEDQPGVNTTTNSQNKPDTGNRSEQILAMDRPEVTIIDLNNTDSRIGTSNPNGPINKTKSGGHRSDKKNGGNGVHTGRNSGNVHDVVSPNRENKRNPDTREISRDIKLSKPNYIELNQFIGGGVWSVLKKDNKWLISDGITTAITGINLYFKDFLESDSILVGFESDLKSLTLITKPKIQIVNLTNEIKQLRLNPVLSELIEYFEITKIEAEALMEIHSNLALRGLRLKPNKFF
jgi:hypothetical protein